MKSHIAFISLMAATLGLFAYLAFSFNERDLFYFHSRDVDFDHFLTELSAAHHPDLELNFSALYGRSGQFEVLHPLLQIGTYEIDHPGASCTSVDLSQTLPIAQKPLCLAATEPAGETAKKSALLDQFLNGQVAQLPDDFLTAGSTNDEFGRSYAYRLVTKGAHPYSDRAWVIEHLSFFKITELDDILTRYHLHEPEYAAIAHMSEDEMEQVIKGASLVITNEYLLVRNQTHYEFSPLSYWAYALRDLSELKTGRYDLVAVAASDYCLDRVGNVCWTYSSQQTITYLYRYSLTILALVGAVIALLLGFYLRHLFVKNRERRKEQLSLQVLSHEFRTPVSSMLLMLERLSQVQGQLDVRDQDLITRFSTEVYRLQRIIEVSRTYLQASGHRLRFAPVRLPSVNDWIADFIAEAELQIECEWLERDQGFEVDPFWLKFVLGNLVQNAFAHGAAPVRIRLSADNGLKIAVEDQGDCEFRTLKPMTDAFVKSNRSQGMGLGLNITKFIVEEWGSELQFAPSPTTFTLNFKRGGAMAKLLIIEDHSNISTSLSEYLGGEGYAVEVAENLAIAGAKLKASPDLIVLDWMLPDGQGLDFLRALRQAGNKMPVIFLTARIDLVDKVLALEMGADDYMTKPFEPRELLARIRVQLREGSPVPVTSVKVGPLEIDRERHQVRFRDRSVDLVKKEFELLMLFAESPEKVFSRDEILNKVWGYDVFPTTRTVDTHVMLLRQKTADELIETVRAVGYRLRRL